MGFETENIEFKVKATDEIYKEVIAFANTDGGTIYVGIEDDGTVVGLDNVDEEYTRIINGIRDAIVPDVTMFVHFTIQNNKVVRITVQEGTNKPYYLRAKGLKPNGVYVRQGVSSAPASPDQIRQMIKISDGDIFEEMRSLEQNLSFQAAERTFERYKVTFSEEKYIALGMQGSQDRMYTNLAWLLSDQCRHSIKVAVFGDEANTVFKDTKEFCGSLFEQLDETFRYLMLCNQTASVFHGLERIELPDYPEAALREALLNAVVHRDYSFSGSIIINVNEKEMEFISIGGLLPGLAPEDIRSGISQPRNKRLADVFHRLHLIESYGTGIRKIFSLYEKNAIQPRIEVTPNTFKMVLPNMNAAAAREEEITKELQLTPQMEKILQSVQKYGSITEEEIRELLGVKYTRAYTLAKQMCEMGVLKTVGRGSVKKYLPV